jgi:hypothetical protein
MVYRIYVVSKICKRVVDTLLKVSAGWLAQTRMSLIYYPIQDLVFCFEALVKAHIAAQLQQEHGV